jgi:DNA polymerase I-like protein with 3'-5' exonuclease and polymerase domains
VLVGFDTEYGFHRHRRLPNGRLRGDESTLQPVCACLFFEDGREVRIADNFEQLQGYFDDPQYTFLVHGAHAEFGFCRRVGVHFPSQFRDTFLMGLLILHASEFCVPDGPYKNAALAELAPRYGIPFISAEDKDAIRQSIAQLNHLAEFGMARVLDYCLEDAKALIKIYPRLRDDMLRACGPNAESNLTELYQPYSLLMAEAGRKGLRFDQRGWDRLLTVTPLHRGRLLDVLRKYGYDHDGVGIGDHAFARLLRNIGLDADWPRTPKGRLSTTEDDIKFAAARHSHPALIALHKLVNFDAFMGQDVGGLVDADGRIRCSILPLAQRTGRNSTVSPNLMGIPGELRPLLLPDEGCRFVHFDYSQQELGVAGYVSGDSGLLDDFARGDVYINLGMRVGLLTPTMPAEERKRIRNSLLKALVLAVLFGKQARSIARDLGISLHDAMVMLLNFQREYPRLFSWLKRFVALSLERGWAENIIGFRAAFNIRDRSKRGHVARSCQNFPIQSSAAACFQLTGLYLGQFGSDIRLPMHDAYVINVPNNPQALADEHQRIISATTLATEQLFPGLAVKRDIDVLSCFAKDGKVNALEELLVELEAHG